MADTAPDRRITMVIHALGGGGAERIFCRLATHWAEIGCDVTVITLDTAQSDVFHLPLSVRRVELGLIRQSHTVWQRLHNTLVRVRRLRAAIRAAGSTQVLSFTDKMNVLTLLACWGGPWQVVIAERNDPRRQRLGFVWEWLRRRTYPRCKAWVVQTEAVARFARSVVRRPVVVIPNAVGSPSLPLPPPELPTTQIIGMGRLSPQKGFDLLIRAFARISPDYPDWSLQIFGEGPERANLQRLAESLGVERRVELPGWCAHPEAALSAAGAFVLPSRYEGFPNALLEAMACGAPCIATACDSGPAEIIRDEVDGILVRPDDVQALTAALRRLISDDALRRRLGLRAVEVASRFDEQTFLAKWDQLVELPAHE